MITHLVRDGFEVVAGRRLKDMVSYAKKSGRKPNWIRGTLWGRMQKYWKTEYAIKRSTKASKARNSDRGGLGPSKHCGGPKSHTRIKHQMSIEEGREVSYSEVFIKTHTRKDGTFVDEKAKQVSEAYNKNLESALSQVEASDAASRTPQLTTAEADAIFLKSTVVNARDVPYGIGRLAEAHVKGKKRVVVGSSSGPIVALEEQLKETQALLQEQAAEASQYKQQMDLMMRYMTEKDPALSTWLKSQSSAPPTTVQPASTPNASSDDEEASDDEEDDERADNNNGLEDHDNEL